MGTKNNPDKFDCYAKAEPDEPLFVLLGRDYLAGHLVAIWAHMRRGDVDKATSVFRDMVDPLGVAHSMPPDPAKANEAMACAGAMFEFYEKRDAGR